jgi:hypothetical protein
VAIAFLFVTWFTYLWAFWTIHREHESCEERLIALEHHRFKFRSLPDSLTLGKIMSSRPEELEKLLEASELSGLPPM